MAKSVGLKLPLLLVVVFLLAVAPSADARRRRGRPGHRRCRKPTPTEFDVRCGYPGYTEENLMCKYQGMGPKCNGKICARDLSNNEKMAIVKKHNELRNNVALGKEKQGVNGIGQPAAADMNQLTWDEDLALLAQRWADQCQYEHDPSGGRTIPDKKMMPIGQNLAMRRAGGPMRNAEFPKMVQWWYDEVKDFNASTVGAFDSNPSIHTGQIGHYTQLVWAKTKKVGCGAIQFQKRCGPRPCFQYHLVCNYYPAGNYMKEPVYSAVGSETEAGSKCENDKRGAEFEGLCP